MGFYPVLPGSDEYALGSPMVKKAIIQLDNGKTLTVNAINQSEKNVYVGKVEVNGEVVFGNAIKHSDIINGGELNFYLQDIPGSPE